MFNSNLIFSDQRSYRIKRHLLFWLFWWLYFGFLHSLNPIISNQTSPLAVFIHNLPYCIIESFLLLIPQTVLAYPLMYFVLPRFIFPGKYFQAFLWLLVFMFLSMNLNALMIMEVNQKILSFLLPAHLTTSIKRPPMLSFYMTMLASLKGGITGAALAVGVKLVKHWYQKEKLNLQLQKENTASQLRLLTAQVHPHFLFNTLNNIYSGAQKESPGTAKMIIELSHIMRYVLDEGKLPLVPLENELQMLKDYINLEKMRYDEKLDLRVSFPPETGNLHIAPLLLLPFVENCFKHGASKMLQNPWINLKIELQGHTLVMKLMNGKKLSWNNFGNRRGTGIENVQSRLKMIYKDKHELNIIEDEEVFVVNLSIQLEMPEISVTKPSPISETAYV